MLRGSSTEAKFVSLLSIVFSGSSHPKVFLGKGVLKICSKLTGEHPCRNVNKVAKQLYCNDTAIGCFPVNLLHIFETPFSKNTFGWLVLIFSHLFFVRNVFLSNTLTSSLNFKIPENLNKSSLERPFAIQFVIFKPLSHCFEESLAYKSSSDASNQVI